MMKAFRHDKTMVLKTFDQRISEYRAVLAKLTPKHHQAETLQEVNERSYNLLFRNFPKEIADAFLVTLAKEGVDKGDWVLERRLKIKRAITELHRLRKIYQDS